MVFGGGRQAFCGTRNCDVVTWNPTESAETFEANARPIRIITNDGDG